MNIKQIITVGIAGVAMGAMALDKVEVTGVTARQRYPWNGLVDIDFTTDSTPTEPYQMKVVAFDNVGKTNLPVKTCYTEDVSFKDNPCMVRTDTRRILWDASADLPNGFKATNVLVTCQDERTISDISDDRYAILDVSGGTNVVSYQLSYTNCPPPGGWTSDYKKNMIVFRKVDAGSFNMGSDVLESDRSRDENLHKVTLTNSYYISIFEITKSQYAKIMGEDEIDDLRPILLTYTTIRGIDFVNYSDGTQSEFCWPNSSSVDSNSVMGVLRKRCSGILFDLPTEAQWEYACRAGSQTPFNNGCQQIGDSGRYTENRNDGKVNVAYTDYIDVGSYDPNAIGIYDMHGNAYEHVLDAYSESYGDDQIDPIGPSPVPCTIRYNVTVGTKFVFRVVRGGRYDSSESACRSAARRVIGYCGGDEYYISGRIGYGDLGSDGNANCGFRLCFAIGNK